MIPITKAVFDEDDFAMIQEPLKSGWVVQGKFVKEFEASFTQLTQSENAIAVSSATTGLHIAVAALGLKPGDEVLVPSFTWVATANCVEYMGARPIFVDIDLRTYNIDVAQIERHITPRTVGIIPVHLFGLSADMEPIMAIARKHNLWVVEDAACGFDTWYRGKHVGTFGEMGVFSFHPRKAITTGEGGMITTDRADLSAASRTLRDHGASASDLDRHEKKHSFLLSEYRRVGYNFRMTDIQGALGVSQMRKSAWMQSERRAGAARYDKLLAGIDWLQLPFRHPDYVHGEQSYVCLFQPEAPSLSSWERVFERRNNIMSAMESQGIITRQGTHAPPHLHFFKETYGIRPEDYPNGFLAERLTITLPLYAGMTEDESVQVVESLKAEFAATSTSSKPGTAGIYA